MEPSGGSMSSCFAALRPIFRQKGQTGNEQKGFSGRYPGADLSPIAMTVSITVVIARRHFGTMQMDLQQRVTMFDYVNDIDKTARQHYTIDEEKLRAALLRGYIEGLGILTPPI